MCHGQNMEYGMPCHRNASGLMTIPSKPGNIDQFTQIFIMVHGTLMVATFTVGEMLANQENACLFRSGQEEQIGIESKQICRV